MNSAWLTHTHTHIVIYRTREWILLKDDMFFILFCISANIVTLLESLRSASIMSRNFNKSPVCDVCVHDGLSFFLYLKEGTWFSPLG